MKTIGIINLDKSGVPTDFEGLAEKIPHNVIIKAIYNNDYRLNWDGVSYTLSYDYNLNKIFLFIDEEYNIIND